MSLNILCYCLFWGYIVQFILNLYARQHNIIFKFWQISRGIGLRVQIPFLNSIKLIKCEQKDTLNCENDKLLKANSFNVWKATKESTLYHHCLIILIYLRNRFIPATGIAG